MPITQLGARRHPPPRFTAVALLSALALTRCTSDQSPTQNADRSLPSPPRDVLGAAEEGSAIFIGAGDIAGCTSGYKADATAPILQRPENAAATVFTLGDNAYPDGSEANYQCYDATWGAVKDRTRPVPGNHEYHQPGAAPYFAYFGAAAGDPAQGYYSYDLAGWHIVALNSEQGLADELSWLRTDLANHPSQCTLAYWHKPYFTSGSTHPGAKETRPFWDALYEAGAEIILGGHNHQYERFDLQRPDGTADGNGIRQFVAGTGGSGSLYPFNDPPAAHSEARWVGNGVLKLTLSPDHYDYEFIPVEGSTFTDAGSAGCHGLPPPNINPVSQFGFSCSGLSCQFTDRSTDEDGIVEKWSWSFGDGKASTAKNPSYSYLAAGTYTATLQVTDSRGGTASSSQTVLVTGPPGVVLVGAGSIASCSSSARDEQTAEVVKTVLSGDPGATVFAAGDLAYDQGTATEFTNCYRPSWGQFKARTRPAPGDREYKLSATPYFDYWNGVGVTSGVAGSRTKGYYSFDLGTWHVVVLNSNNAAVPSKAGSAQDQWLQADLAASTKQCTLGIWHLDRFASGTTSPLPVLSQLTQAFWEDLYSAGGELAIVGNGMRYERFGPQTTMGIADAAYGLRQITVGTGGKGLSRPTVRAPNSEVMDGSSFGVIKLTLEAASYRWEFLPIAGSTFTDSGSGNCHGKPPANVRPVSKFTKFCTGRACTFTDQSSDADGRVITQWTWYFGDGKTATTKNASHTYAAAGSYTVGLTVRDSRGATKTSSQMLTLP